MEIAYSCLSMIRGVPPPVRHPSKRVKGRRKKRVLLAEILRDDIGVEGHLYYVFQFRMHGLFISSLIPLSDERLFSKRELNKTISVFNALHYYTEIA